MGEIEGYDVVANQQGWRPGRVDPVGPKRSVAGPGSGWLLNRWPVSDLSAAMALRWLVWGCISRSTEMHLPLGILLVSHVEALPVASFTWAFTWSLQVIGGRVIPRDLYHSAACG